MLGLLKPVFGSASSTISHRACLNLCQRVTAHWNVWKRYVPWLNPLVFIHRNNWESHLNFLGRLIHQKMWAKESGGTCCPPKCCLLEPGIWRAHYSVCFTYLSNNEWLRACNVLILCSICKHTLLSMAKLLITWNS